MADAYGEGDLQTFNSSGDRAISLPDLSLDLWPHGILSVFAMQEEL